MQRPLPPQDLTDPRRLAEVFRPAPELEAWARSTFVARDGALSNPDHRHLNFARIGFLWASVGYAKGPKRVTGTAEIFRPKGNRWQIARQEQQLREWFGLAPLDFIITIDSVYWNLTTDLVACALIEHELYHCAQALDQFGAPRFSRETGLPLFALHPHDAEEFVGVVRRYGVGAAAGGVRELVEAAKKAPEIGAAQAGAACGTCLRRVA